MEPESRAAFPVVRVPGGGITSLLGAVALAFFLFALVPAMQIFESRDQDRMEYREIISVSAPPPEMPPLPEDRISNQQEELLMVQMAAPEAVVDIDRFDVSVNPGPGFGTGVGFGPANFSVNMNVDIQSDIQDIFNFDDLAQPPRLINASDISMNFPRELKRQGIKAVDLKVLILIDHRGHADVEKILSSSHSHPSVTREAEAIVRQMRFTVTEIDGRKIKVRAPIPISLKSAR